MTRFIAAPLLSLFLFSTLQAQENTSSRSKSLGPARVIRKSDKLLQKEAIKKVSPVCPPLALAAKVKGQVVVEITIDEQGNVIKTKVISGHPLLKHAAEQAAQGWKFKPTKLSGVPVKVSGNITFNFACDVSTRPEDLASLEEKVRKNPASSEDRYELGAAYYKLVRFDEAATELEEAIRLRPEFAEAHCKLGLCYERLKRYSEAIRELKEAIRIKPDQAEAFAGLGAVEAMLYRYDEAITNFKKAIEIEPTAADTYFMLGMIYFATGQKSEAITTFKQGLILTPDNAFWHFELGKIYLEFGDKKGAMEVYTLLKKLDLGFAEDLLKQINK